MCKSCFSVWRCQSLLLSRLTEQPSSVSLLPGCSVSLKGDEQLKLRDLFYINEKVLWKCSIWLKFWLYFYTLQMMDDI